MTANNFSKVSATRVKSTFLVKPMYEGKSFSCFESGFNATRQNSIRVNNMEDLRLQVDECLGVGSLNHNRIKNLPLVADLNPALYQQFVDYLGKQPLFYFQERFAPECPGYEWNGFLLFSILGTEYARKVVLDHKDELHVVLAFDDPDSDIYYILIDTETGGGSLEDFVRWQEDIRDMVLLPYFHNPVGYMLNYYSRALAPRHYDVVDADVLFGKPIESVKGYNTSKPRSLNSQIKKFMTAIGLIK